MLKKKTENGTGICWKLILNNQTSLFFSPHRHLNMKHRGEGGGWKYTRNLHIIGRTHYAHTYKTTRLNSPLTTCISVLEVIAHPEGLEVGTPHDQTFLSQHTNSHSNSYSPEITD